MAIVGNQSHELGRLAEQAAEQYLARHGLSLVQRNFRGKQGEIDLIMDDGKVLVFIEVRHRRSSRFGSAVESINPRKQARLIKTAELYISAASGASQRQCRFDTIDFDGEITDNNLRWIKNAFAASGS